jgi:hypothetical protein
VVAKCGTNLAWHWAHIAAVCDPWAEPETEWHQWWKRHLRDRAGARLEQVIGRHRADALLPDGRVVELQSAYLSVEQIAERERFYGARMVWLYRCTWEDRLHFGKRGFWWKHGAPSMACHRCAVWWHFPDGRLYRVSLGLVEADFGAKRILGKVKRRAFSRSAKLDCQFSRAPLFGT